MKFKDTVEILRPINDLMGTLTVIIGILNTRTGIAPEIIVFNIVMGMITYFFIAGSGMVINDIYDIEIDKINRPDRPIPRGAITLKQAKILFAGTLLIGIVFSVIHSFVLSLGMLNILLAIIFGLMGWIYAKWGKKSGFFGNILVSISFSIGLIYGAVLNSMIIPIYIYFFFLTSFFLLISREIVKGCEDISGDKEHGVKTLAVLYGVDITMRVAAFTELAAIVFFILPSFFQIINPILFVFTSIAGLAIVALAFFLTLRGSSQGHYKFSKISLYLKVGAMLGLIAFIFASI